MLAALSRYALTLTRPAIFLGAIVVGLALVAEPRAMTHSTQCTGITGSAEINRMLCMLSPAKLFSGQRNSLF